MTVEARYLVPEDLVAALWAGSQPEPEVPELPAWMLEQDALPWEQTIAEPCDPSCTCGGDPDLPCTAEWDALVAALVPAAAETAPEPEAEWAVPGVTWDREPVPTALPAPSRGVAELQRLIAALECTAPVVLGDSQALADAEAVQQAVARLRTLLLGYTGEVDRRGLWTLRGLRSTGGWLAVHAPDAVPADRTLASRLRSLPVLDAAVREGRVSLAAAVEVARAQRKVAHYLDRKDGLVDGQPGEPLVQQVVENTVALVAQGHGGLAEDHPALGAVVARVEAIQASAQTGASQAARVEAAFTLLAEHLPPGVPVKRALEQQVDAVLPNLLEAQQQRAEEQRGLALTPEPDGSWHLEGRLTPEVGEQLFTALAAEARRDPGNPVDTRARAAARAAGDSTDPTPFTDLPRWEQQAVKDLFGRPGPGSPEHDEQAEALGALLDLDPTDPAQAQQADDLAQLVPRTPSRRLHDAFGRLLTRYLGAGLGGVLDKTPVQVAVTVPHALLEGRPGALPGRSTRTGRSLARSLLRRWWGDAHVTTLLLSHGWTPLGIVHSARTATGRERQAVGVQWDFRCPGTDCCPPTPSPLRPLIPHHVRTFASNGGRTSLGETLPVCQTLHDDLHLGGKTIRLRDGRLINEHGYLEDS